jgi:ABC-type nitrate/sulfonate/bicarbonate transport system substrate-binding protein
MKQLQKRFIAFLLSVALIVPSYLAAASTPPKKLRGAFTAFAYANPPFWLAKDLRLFEKYGLDVELVYVCGVRNIQALIGGSIDVSPRRVARARRCCGSRRRRGDPGHRL